jgi:hypothetical protein
VGWPIPHNTEITTKNTGIGSHIKKTNHPVCRSIVDWSADAFILALRFSRVFIKNSLQTTITAVRLEPAFPLKMLLYPMERHRQSYRCTAQKEKARRNRAFQENKMWLIMPPWQRLPSPRH